MEILKENGVAEQDMVTLDKLDKNSELYKDVMKKIRTETYGSEDVSDKDHTHDGPGYKRLSRNPAETPQTSEKFMAKDAKDKKNIFTKLFGKYKGYKHPSHDTSKRLALEATVDLFQRQKDEKEKAKQQPPSNQ